MTKKSIYLIGNIPNTIDDNCEIKFYRTKLHLMNLGFNVVNPIERLLYSDLNYEDANRKNIQDLICSDAVYIMPCMHLTNMRKNFALKFAIDLNLTFISGTVEVNSDTIHGTNLKIDKKISAV